MLDEQQIIRRVNPQAARWCGCWSPAKPYPLAGFALLNAVSDAGKPFMVPDVRTAAVDEELRQLCVALHVISYLNVPVLQSGRTVGVLGLVHSTPRIWTATEVELA